MKLSDLELETLCFIEAERQVGQEMHDPVLPVDRMIARGYAARAMIGPPFLTPNGKVSLITTIPDPSDPSQIDKVRFDQRVAYHAARIRSNLAQLVPE